MATFRPGNNFNTFKARLNDYCTNQDYARFALSSVVKNPEIYPGARFWLKQTGEDCIIVQANHDSLIMIVSLENGGSLYESIFAEDLEEIIELYFIKE